MYGGWDLKVCGAFFMNESRKYPIKIEKDGEIIVYWYSE